MDLNKDKDKIMLLGFDGYADRFNQKEAKKISDKLKNLGEQFILPV